MTSMAAVAPLGNVGGLRVPSGALAEGAATRPSLRRAGGVGVGLRVVNALFGSPSIRRANGGAESSVLPQVLRAGVWCERRAQTPVFAVDRRGTEGSERLPRVWVTEPVHDVETGALVGRAYVGSYPTDPDRGGWRALELADRYFGEALGYEEADELTGRAAGSGVVGASDARAMRVECFRAAEVLLLHAARRGNDEACLRLAHMYQHDLCEGRYWKGALEHRARHAHEASREQRAAACLAQAASHGKAEALWRLGDVLARMGGERNLSCAYDLFRRSFDLACRPVSANNACAGQAALRLGRCHELGRGCGFSFKKAQSWYRIATEHLEEACGSGEWECKRALHDAHVGAHRMAQEMSGRY